MPEGINGEARMGPCARKRENKVESGRPSNVVCGLVACRGGCCSQAPLTSGVVTGTAVPQAPRSIMYTIMVTGPWGPLPPLSLEACRSARWRWNGCCWPRPTAVSMISRLSVCCGDSRKVGACTS